MFSCNGISVERDERSRTTARPGHFALATHQAEVIAALKAVLQ